MKRRFQVTLYQFYGHECRTVLERSFRSANTAFRFADKLNHKHCHETRQGSRCNMVVEVGTYRQIAGNLHYSYEALPAEIVPSVGELGYW